jgi:hypothetical protein
MFSECSLNVYESVAQLIIYYVVFRVATACLIQDLNDKYKLQISQKRTKWAVKSIDLPTLGILN